jgi:hypothetical protein
LFFYESCSIPEDCNKISCHKSHNKDNLKKI